MLANLCDVRNDPDDDVDALGNSSVTHFHIGEDSCNCADSNSMGILHSNIGNNTFYRTLVASPEFGYWRELWQRRWGTMRLEVKH